MNIIIAGGGFAGLKLARELNNKKGMEVLLIDKNNYHQFQPLLYQVATAGLDASNISFPLRKVFHKSKNVRFRMADILEIKTTERIVITDTGNFSFDVLIIATGAGTNFFGNPEIMKNTFPMKSTTEALQLRHRIIENFEEALSATTDIEMQKKLTMVVVGGGPTGVEVSGALAEMKKTVLPHDYPELDFSKMQIHLIEGSTKTLASMSEKSSIQSNTYLDTLGVKVWTNTMVTSYDGDTVTLSNGKNLTASIVIWAAGIKGNVPAGIDASLIARGNRIAVDRMNKVQGSDSIYALGDIAFMATELYPNGHPQVATVALDQAKNVARNILGSRTSNRFIPRPFEYKDKGSMATVGRHLAVVDIPKPRLHFGGLIAWIIWMGLHLFLILGVKNKIQVFINWMYKYFTYDQSLRLLFRNTYRKENTTDNSKKQLP